jgi:hypothetical protein
MSNADPGTAPVRPPRDHATEGGYTLDFSPLFLARCTAAVAGGPEVVVFQQTVRPFLLPEGRSEPPRQTALRLSGGPLARDFGLFLDDPLHEVLRITVELKPKGHPCGQPTEPAETVTFAENWEYCPPVC